MLGPLVWLLVVEILGLLAFPLAFVLFSRLPDRGYAFAKPLALVLASYLLWVLGLTQLVPNSRFTIIGILLLGALVSGWLFRRHYQQIKGFLRSQWPMLLVADLVFLAFFGFWLAVVSSAPAINHTEKPMDFAFLNAILQSQHFPPEDPWLAGHPISYYYFGHFMMAMLVKLTGVSSAAGYNIAVALIPALLATGSFGLLYNLVRLSGGTPRAGLSFGLLAPVLLMLVGNLEGTLEFVHAQGWGSEGLWQWVGIKGLGSAAGSGPSVFPEQTWWWWRATRVIDTLVDGRSLDYTITEFPFFSFILGDLHPHMTSLPFLVLFLALGLNLFASPDRLGLGWLLRHPIQAAALALVLGALAFINVWDFPVFAAMLAAIIFAKSYGQECVPGRQPRLSATARTPALSRGERGPSLTTVAEGGEVCHGFTGGNGSEASQPGAHMASEASNATATLSRAALNTGLMAAPLIAVAVVLFLPFYLDLSSQASGILPVTGPGTRPFLFFLVMGLPVVIAVSFLLRQLPGLPRPGPGDAPAALLIVVAASIPVALWIIITLALAPFTDGMATALARVGSRLILVVPGLALAGLAGFSALQRWRYLQEPADAFPLLLAAAAFYLMSGAELFFLVDFFGNRMNTIFKVYYQAWLLLAVAGVYGLYYWQARWETRKTAYRMAQFAWLGLVAVLVLASFYYPVGAVMDRTGLLTDSRTLDNNTLNGLAFIRESDPGEYAAITWLRDAAPPGRIVEAVGDDYSDHGRISASTGWPTILGWKGHEHQWRGATTLLEGREEDVASIYQSDNPQTVHRLLERYDIRYVYLGQREQARYGITNLDKFDGFLRTAFESAGVIIYERMNGPDLSPQPTANNDAS